MNGIDNLKGYGNLLAGKRLGLITNPSGTDRQLTATIDILAKYFKLTALFGPEHGVRGDCQAGRPVEFYRDPVWDVPVYSLHGKSLRIQEEQFSEFDTLVYDIQDVGARFYTYLYTLSYAMEDCAKHNIPVVVLDRVNPLGCVVTEGIRLDSKLQSFVGMYPIPTRYALTIGEYARYVNDTFGFNCNLTIIPCLNYRRDMSYSETRLPWIMPSPNIPTQESAVAYIGTCLFEGTNISEGRGTTHPFEIIGAPSLNANTLADNLNARHLPGIIWRAAHFIPTFSKHVGVLCHGVQMHITDQATCRPFEAGLWLLDEIRQMAPDFEFRAAHFDHLLGTDSLRLGTETTEQIIARAKQESVEFQQQTMKYRLY